MSKEALIKSVAVESGATQVVVNGVLASLAKVTQKALRDGEKVTIPGVGILTPVVRAPRAVRNPRTGESLGKTAAKRSVKFKAAKAALDFIAK